jgi:uncharacterized protein (TIGR02453 family)
MLDTYTQFMRELNVNNNKVWFDNNRDRWKNISKDWQVLIQQIIHEIAKFDHSMNFVLPKQCIYRINRDVRFSHNKNPYKDYISAVFSPKGKQDGCIAYYFEITADGQLRTGGGWYEIEPKRLFALRNHIAENLDDIEELRTILKNPKFAKKFNGLSEFSNLKTHPKGFTKDQINIDLLKHKNFITSTNRKLTFKNDDDFVKQVVTDFEIITPFIKFLRNWENIN